MGKFKLFVVFVISGANMKFRLDDKKINQVKEDVLTVFLFEGEKLPGELKEFEKYTKKEKFKGKEGECFESPSFGKKGFEYLLLIGLGKKKEFDNNILRTAAANAYHLGNSKNAKSIALKFSLDKDSVCAAVEGINLTSYKFEEYMKKKDEDKDTIKEINIIAGKKFQKEMDEAIILTDAQNYSRIIDNLPPNVLTPNKFAEYAKKLGKENKMSVKVFGKKELEKMKMGALLAVNQGSVEPPVLVVMEYNKGKKYPLYSIIGKGITFDSGGVSLKPSDGMHEMKFDKSGACVCLGIMKAVSELKLPVRLNAIIPATENMVGSKAYKPSDIITAYSGKTIEIRNTDAEGRLILADAVAYAAKQKPKLLIDIATLTGAAFVVLGRQGACMLTNDEKANKVFEDAGNKTYERVWRLPLWKEYDKLIKSDVAEIKNIGGEKGGASTIIGGIFIKEFIGDSKWVHLDIASVDNIPGSHSYYAKGSTGVGVRLVSEALRKLK